MGQKLDAFAAQCHDILKAGTGAENLEKVKTLLEPLLVDPEFVAEHLGPDFESNREILYQDPELDFCILAHLYKGTNAAPPHDHGPTWAIYGQSVGVTHMTEYKKLAEAAGDQPGKVEPVKSYDLKPGMAVAYPTGALHAPKREGDTKLIRMEGTDVSKLKRDKYVVA
jgi:predicted metal-dependent enzyme (double-stranded beta helix superfamily)